MRSSLLAGILVAAVLSSPTIGVAQQALPGRFEVGLTLGATPNLSPAFDRCGTRVAGRLGSRLGYRLPSSWHLDLRTEMVASGSNSTCFICEACFCSFGRCVPGPPSAGPYVAHDGRFEPPLPGSRFWTTSLGSEWTAADRPGHEWRVRVGLGRLWSKRVWVPQMASSFHWGAGPVRGIFEFGLWHYTLRRTDVEAWYLDGQIVSQARSRVPIHETTLFVDVGFTIGSLRSH